MANTQLKGLQVVSFESRMAGEMQKLVQNFGGSVLSAPSMQEIPLEKNQDAFEFGEKLMAGKIDMVIFTTGVGARALFKALETRHSKDEIVKALSSVVTVIRGPKPMRVMKEYGIPVSVAVPEPNTWRELLHEIDEHEESIRVEGKTVAIQEYGEANDELIEGLKKRKAVVIRVPVYRWALPDDMRPLKEGIRAVLDGRVDVALFTNKVQIDHVMRVAAEEGQEDKLKKAFRGVVVASVGPICTEGIVSHGIMVDFESIHSKIGSFVMETAQNAPEILRKKKSPGRIEASSKADAADRGFSEAALRDSVFMKACRREKAGVTPVWLMRQAGRYMKEYREIRRRLSFLDFCRDKELVTEVTVKAQEFLDADAAIIFSDILLVVETFGLELEFAADEGPVIQTELGEGKGIVDAIRRADTRHSLKFVLDAIKQTRGALKKNIPLLGFAGAPFTLASYMIEGGTSKTFRRTKTFMYQDPVRWREMLEAIADVLADYLTAQIEAGAQAVQLFDSWAGCLGPEDYKEYAAPYSARAIRGIKAKAPVIHFGTGTSAFLEEMSSAGGDVIGVDYRVKLDDAWKRIGGKAIQGNLDPLVLLADKPFIKKRVQQILAQAGGKPGHIFNLGHGVLPETPPDHARYLIDLVHDLSR